MRRREEGYVLLYVVIVIVLLCVLAMGVCTISLRNLQSQQASIERTRQLYEAEGQIEWFVAEAKGGGENISGTVPPKEEDETDPEAAAKAQAESAFGTLLVKLGELEEDGPFLEELGLEVSGTNPYTVTVTAQSGTVSVTAEIKFVLSVLAVPVPADSGEAAAAEEEETGEEEGAGETEWSYSVDKVSVTYLSYTIGSVEPSAEPGETG